MIHPDIDPARDPLVPRCPACLHRGNATGGSACSARSAEILPQCALSQPPPWSEPALLGGQNQPGGDDVGRHLESVTLHRPSRP